MRLAVLTFHRAFNCGAMLQAWALKTVLERMGHTVEFPNWNTVGYAERWVPFVKKDSLVKQLISIVYRLLLNMFSIGYQDCIRAKYLRFQKYILPFVNLPMAEAASRYDGMVVGSDQVWNERISSPNTALFLGEGISDGIPFVAYAASMGDMIPSETYCQQIQRALPRFNAVSMRESSGTERIRALCDREVVTVLDPTLLLTAQDYDEIRAPLQMKKEMLFTYAASHSDEMLEYIHAVAKALKVRCRISRPYEISRITTPRTIAYPVSPAELLACTAQAKYVIPASFHGMVFALLYRKPFVIMRPKTDTIETRPAALLKRLGMENRIVTPKTSIPEFISILQQPYPEDFEERLAALRRESLAWLKQALDNLTK